MPKSRSALSHFCSRALCSLAALAFAAPAGATTFTVLNTGDSGAGSLRQAILDANGNAGADRIEFAIPGSGVQTITPATALSAISDTVVIDGYTQPGASANTQATGTDAVLLVELVGAGSGNGLTVNASGCTIQGLVVRGFGVRTTSSPKTPSPTTETPVSTIASA